MATTIDSLVINPGPKRYVVKKVGTDDGNGSSAVVLVDVSSLTGPDGTAATKMVLEEISWDIQGYTSIKLLWDADTDDELISLGSGSGAMSWAAVGGLKDPRSTGAVGDILITTAGHTATSTFTITLVLRLKD